MGLTIEAGSFPAGHQQTLCKGYFVITRLQILAFTRGNVNFQVCFLLLLKCQAQAGKLLMSSCKYLCRGTGKHLQGNGYSILGLPACRECLQGSLAKCCTVRQCESAYDCHSLVMVDSWTNLPRGSQFSPLVRMCTCKSNTSL